jgi:hypothetical protein
LIPASRPRSPTTLVCCAIPLGYGPAAKLAVLAEALCVRGVRLMFVGRGIALEFARRHGHLFADIVAADSPSGVSAEIWRSAAGVLSVMDRDFASAAAEFGKPLFVVDSLLWMRPSVPTAWRSAQRLWAQNFVGLNECQDLHWPGLTIVGPIVAAPSAGKAASPDCLLINLGGCESAGRERSNATSYARFVVDQLIASPLLLQFAGRTILVAGERCIADLRKQYGDSQIEFQSLSHAAALAQLDRAALVLTAPGLTMSLECFQRGVPTFFLPPQNYSQWCILRALRDLDLAPAALHWEDFSPNRLADRLPEEVRNPIVQQAIAYGTADPEAGRKLRHGLAQITEMDQPKLASRQTAFFESLGTNGVETIADELAAGLQSGRTSPAVPASTP